jgi:hypothetical protein
MFMDFKAFKKGKGKLEKSVAKMKDQNPKFKKDERFWVPIKDDTGSANALIRFLPQPDIEAPPSISFFQHGFKEKGKWFIDNCPSTFDNPCPVCEYIQPYWDEDTDESHAIARRYSRSKQYIANILVIKDLNQPANNGKVFLFKFGVKLYEKIEEKIFPESEIDDAIQVFDPWTGCNFKLKLRQKHKMNNYDTSEFATDNCGPVCKSDEALEVIFNQMLPLDEFLADKLYPEYGKMKKKFNRIMKIKDGSSEPEKKAADDKGDKLLDEFSDGPDDNSKADGTAKEAEKKTEDEFNFEDEPVKTDAAPETKSEPADEKKAGDDNEFDFEETGGDDKDFSFDDD